MDFPDAKYRKLCSQTTLHTRDGFFPDLLSTITEGVGLNWIDKVFAKETLDKDKIRVCCSDSRVWNVIHGVLKNVEKMYRKKSAKAAMESRLDGEKAMKDGSFKRAVMIFSQSVIKAPKLKEDTSVDDGFTLPYAFRLRAQAHAALHRFQACLTDLHLAIESGYPEPLRYQIYKAMGDAYRDLREDKRAKISWQIALKLLDEQIDKLETTEAKGSKKTKAKDGKLKQVLEKEREEIRKAISAKLTGLSIGENLPPQAHAPLPKIAEGRHEKYTEASSLLSIRRTVEEGRFAVTTADVSTATTLVVEEPYASVLITDKFGSHCHHCFSRLHSPVPCHTCAGLAFCSSACRKAADAYHVYECQHLGLLQGAGLSAIAYLALRMVTQEGFSFFKALQGKIEALKGGAEEQLSDREAKYVHIYNLTAHSTLRPNEDFFQRAVMSLFLVYCLKQTDFFPKSSNSEGGKNLTGDEILCASLLLHHLQVLQFNAHELYETATPQKGQSKGSKAIYMAVGIYPTVALFNHECAPAVTRYFHGKHIIIRTVRPLKKGEVISENYGPIFTKRTHTERMRDLTSRYWFKCDCQPCKEQWPLLDQLSEENQRLRCSTPQCKMLFPVPQSTSKNEMNPRCPSCFNRVNLTEVLTQVTHYQTLYDRGMKYLQEHRPELAEPLLTVYLDKIYGLSPPPLREISLAQEGLRTCFAQNGNLWIVDN